MASWLVIERQGAPSERPLRHALRAGLTRVGGPGCELEIEGSGADQLHVWDDPPRLVFVGVGTRPRVAGSEVDTRALAPGDRIEWGGLSLTLEVDPGPALIEEIPVPVASTPSSALDARPWRRVESGIRVELGLADRASARRWQEAVKAGTFDPDACAAELLKEDVTPELSQRVLERSGRLQRDLLMAPLLRGPRGAGRALRGAARSGLGYLVSQLLVALVFGGLFALTLLVVRLRWGWSVDGFLDTILDLIPG